MATPPRWRSSSWSTATSRPRARTAARSRSSRPKAKNKTGLAGSGKGRLRAALFFGLLRLVSLELWVEHLAGQGHEVLALPHPRAGGAAGRLAARYVRAGARIIEPRDAYVDSRTLVICNTIFAAEELIAASACASAVIFPAAYLIDGVYRSFLHGLPHEKLHVVANGVDEPPPGGKRAEGPFRIVAVGTIQDRKRQQDLARAIDALPDLPLQCRMIGQIEELDAELRRRIEARPDRFQLTGELSHEDTLAAIGEADILAQPSAGEALPLAPLEGGIRGKPLVLSNLPVYADIWRHGENCLMHAVGDADLLAILVRDEALRARFAAAALATARLYRSEVMLAQLDQIVARVRLSFAKLI